MTNYLKKFIRDEKSGGLILIVCTIISLFIANSAFSQQYAHFWHTNIGGLSIELWINDALMAIFFLMVGLELKYEIYAGEFSNPKNAVLPIVAALGGMLIPALFFLYFNYGTPTLSGIGIPMATDIAFALGILSLLGKRVPPSLKVFLMALAVIDDLGAIIVIAVFYTKDFHFAYLLCALGVYLVLLILNKKKVYSLIPYLIGGAVMWYFMFQSGVHSTIAGVLLAFAIPFSVKEDDKSPSSYLMRKLQIPVTFFILPLFALANTAITVAPDLGSLLSEPLTLGISSGLVLGKPIGITLACLLTVSLKWAKLPTGSNWTELVGVACLGGIGFTMSIFISILAFDDPDIVNKAKFDVLISSLSAAIIGFTYLRITLKKS